MLPATPAPVHVIGIESSCSIQRHLLLNCGTRFFRQQSQNDSSREDTTGTALSYSGSNSNSLISVSAQPLWGAMPACGAEGMSAG